MILPEKEQCEKKKKRDGRGAPPPSHERCFEKSVQVIRRLNGGHSIDSSLSSLHSRVKEKKKKYPLPMNIGNQVTRDLRWKKAEKDLQALIHYTLLRSRERNRNSRKKKRAMSEKKDINKKEKR